MLGVTAGTIFGLRAKSIWADAKAHCSTYPSACDQAAVNLGQDAKEAGGISTVSFVIGGAGLIGGALLYFTAPKDAPEKALFCSRRERRSLPANNSKSTKQYQQRQLHTAF